MFFLYGIIELNLKLFDMKKHLVEIDCPKCDAVRSFIVWWKTLYLPDKKYGYSLIKSVKTRYECENGHRFTKNRKG